MLKDNQSSTREKKFERWQKEESKERRAEHSKREQSRSQHLQSFYTTNRSLENKAHTAGKSHIEEVYRSMGETRERDFLEAEKSRERQQRDEQHFRQRRALLKKQCDKEANESKQILSSMEQSTQNHQRNLQERLNQTKHRLQEHFDHAKEICENFGATQTEMSLKAFEKDVSSLRMQQRKRNQLQQRIKTSTDERHAGNQARFSKAFDEQHKLEKSAEEHQRQVLKRAQSKEQVREEILRRKQLERQVKAEQHRLRVQDAQENLDVQRSFRQ